MSTLDEIIQDVQERERLGQLPPAPDVDEEVYIPSDPEQIEGPNLEGAQGAIAGTNAFLNSATFGGWGLYNRGTRALADAVLNFKNPVQAWEDQGEKIREEYESLSPATRVSAEISGAIAPALLTGGSSLIASGARAAPKTLAAGLSDDLAKVALEAGKSIDDVAKAAGNVVRGGRFATQTGAAATLGAAGSLGTDLGAARLEDSEDVLQSGLLGAAFGTGAKVLGDAGRGAVNRLFKPFSKDISSVQGRGQVRGVAARDLRNKVLAPDDQGYTLADRYSAADPGTFTPDNFARQADELADLNPDIPLGTQARLDEAGDVLPQDRSLLNLTRRLSAKPGSEYPTRPILERIREKTADPVRIFDELMQPKSAKQIKAAQAEERKMYSQLWGQFFQATDSSPRININRRDVAALQQQLVNLFDQPRVVSSGYRNVGAKLSNRLRQLAETKSRMKRGVTPKDLHEFRAAAIDDIIGAAARKKGSKAKPAAIIQAASRARNIINNMIDEYAPGYKALQNKTRPFYVSLEADRLAEQIALKGTAKDLELLLKEFPAQSQKDAILRRVVSAYANKFGKSRKSLINLMDNNEFMEKLTVLNPKAADDFNLRYKELFRDKDIAAILNQAMEYRAGMTGQERNEFLDAALDAFDLSQIGGGMFGAGTQSAASQLSAFRAIMRRVLGGDPYTAADSLLAEIVSSPPADAANSLRSLANIEDVLYQNPRLPIDSLAAGVGAANTRETLD